MIDLDKENESRRYGDLPLDEICRLLSSEDFTVFLETVGAIEIPLAWTKNGKQILDDDTLFAQAQP